MESVLTDQEKNDYIQELQMSFFDLYTYTILNQLKLSKKRKKELNTLYNEILQVLPEEQVDKYPEHLFLNISFGIK